MKLSPVSFSGAALSSRGAASLCALNAPPPATIRSGRISVRSVAPAAEGMAELKTTVPVFTLPEVMQQLQAHKHEAQKTYRAMYSSVVGGITTDPAAMVIPMDDHMVHRGHGVFDTAIIIDGHLYELDAHLDRFHNSASKAQIQPPFDRATMKDILVQTVASSGCRGGNLRYWLSAGPGGFDLSSSECITSALYAVVLEASFPRPGTGIKVITSSVPIKHPQFATMKNVNYLPNALSKMEAESKGAFAAIWLDEEGFVAEGPNVNVAFVTKSKKLLVPFFDKILSGCTARRAFALAPKLVEEGILSGIEMKNILPEEAKNCSEMMIIGSGMPITPVIEWDGLTIGNGEPGPCTLALRNLMIDDIRHSSALKVSVPYAT